MMGGTGSESSRSPQLCPRGGIAATIYLTDDDLVTRSAELQRDGSVLLVLNTRTLDGVLREVLMQALRWREGTPQVPPAH